MRDESDARCAATLGSPDGQRSRRLSKNGAESSETAEPSKEGPGEAQRRQGVRDDVRKKGDFGTLRLYFGEFSVQSIEAFAGLRHALADLLFLSHRLALLRSTRSLGRFGPSQSSIKGHPTDHEGSPGAATGLGGDVPRRTVSKFNGNI